MKWVVIWIVLSSAFLIVLVEGVQCSGNTVIENGITKDTVTCRLLPRWW